MYELWTIIYHSPQRVCSSAIEPMVIKLVGSMCGVKLSQYTNWERTWENWDLDFFSWSLCCFHIMIQFINLLNFLLINFPVKWSVQVICLIPGVFNGFPRILCPKTFTLRVTSQSPIQVTLMILFKFLESSPNITDNWMINFHLKILMFSRGNNDGRNYHHVLLSLFRTHGLPFGDARPRSILIN